MKSFRLIAALLALVLAATACGSDDDSSADSGGDGRFVYANPFPISDLDPSSAFSSENVVLQNVYESLTTFNPPGSAELVSGSLAESWTSNDDATEWTFVLREGVTFHDGTDLTAEAVKASLERTIEMDLGAAFILLPILEINAEDEQTISFVLADTYAFFQGFEI